MRKIAVVGGGQAGTVVALGLQKQGHDVTLIEALTPDDMRRGRIRSTAVVWQEQIELEHDLGLDFWPGEVRTIGSAQVQLRTVDARVVSTARGKLDALAYGIDQRTKFSRFMEEFKRRGGRLLVQSVDVDDLDDLAGESDLVIVAAGKADIRNLFEIDNVRTVFDGPPRKNMAVILKNVREWTPGDPSMLRFDFYQGLGDWFSLPFFNEYVGPCRAVVFQSVAGSAFDVFDNVKSPADALDRAHWLIREYAPDDWDHFKDSELSDENAWLVGGVRPLYRHPVGTLPSGRKVMALGDAAMTHEPICGCGANSALRQVRTVLDAVARHGDQPFDDEWMAAAVEKEYRTEGRYIFDFVHSITSDPTPAAWLLFQAAHQSPGVSERLVNMYRSYSTTARWLWDMDAVKSLLAEFGDELKNAEYVPLEEAFTPGSVAIRAAE